MKKTLLIALTIALLVAGGSFTYKWWKQNHLNIWSFIPTNSIFVFQPTDIARIWSTEEEFKILKNIKSLSSLDSIQAVITAMDSLVSGQLLRTANEGNLLISFHQNTNESLAALYVLEVSHLSQHKVFGDVFSMLQDSLDFVLSERLYQDYVVTEFKKGDTQLAYIFHKNFIIASFSPFLVEDAIRMITNDKSNSYVEDEPLLPYLNVATGAGRVFVNTDLLDKLARIFAHPIETDTSPLKWLTHLMYLDLTMDNDKIDLAGFSINDTSRVNYLSAFDGVRGVGFEMKNVIPASAAYVVHHSFDDIEKWHRGLKNYWRKHEPAQLTRIGEIENRYQFDILDFYRLVANEIGLFFIPSNRSKDADKVLCMKHQDTELAAQIMNNLSHKANADTTWYHENYAGRGIAKIEIDELPARLFGGLFSGFPTSYYFIDNEFVYIANSQQALEILIDAIDNENTWRKSIKTNKFLETTNDDANFSIYFKSSGVFDLLKDQLNENWTTYLEENKDILKQVEYGAIQFTNVDNKYYTNLSVQHPGDLVKHVVARDFEVKQALTFDNLLISKPFGVRNHNDKSLEMMVQDEENTLHLVSSENEIVLSIPLGGPLASKVYQLDYYKNRKLQYLFTLSNTIHIIDRTGTYIPGYPKSFNSENMLSKLSLLDYDKTRNYRVLAGDESGKFYMYNKSGKELTGWKGKQMLGKPVTNGTHLRIGNTDVLIFLLKNGIVQVLNRKGTTKKGFPIDLKGDYSNPFFIDKGSSLANTYVTSLSDLGEQVTFNLLGEITKRNQMLREDENQRFRLVLSNGKKEYIIIKEQNDNLVVYNQSLAELFSVPKPSTDLAYQYYKFGNDNQLLVIHDQINHESYLYSLGGRLLHKEPLATVGKLAVLNQASRDSYQIYLADEYQMKVLELKR